MRLKNHLTNTKQNWVNHRIETHWRTPVSSMSPRYVQIYYSDWLIGELFSYTELKKNLILTAAALSSKYWHGMAPHKSSPGTFPGKTSPKLWSLSCLLFFPTIKTRTLVTLNCTLQRMSCLFAASESGKYTIYCQLLEGFFFPKGYIQFKATT
jgi:hypothetical protein